MPAIATPVYRPALNVECERIVVYGVVQGVGFRPFVYRLANELGVKGDVCNSDGRVVINAVATRGILAAFKSRLVSSPPPHALLDRIECTCGTLKEYDSFGISISDQRLMNGPPVFVIPADLATCADCLHEMYDPSNRRYLYPFINCTNCGPRYSIVTAFPYDRSRTTMQQFRMCPECTREYNNPLDRRFHAEPISCSNCGPQMSLCDADGCTIALSQSDILLRACEAIRSGGIVAVKGIGGFHLLVDARNEMAVARLRDRKAREAKPLALMYPALVTIKADCHVDEDEARLLTGAAAPILLLQRQRYPSSTWTLAEAIAPGSPLLGVMLPYSPLHHLILRNLGFPVVATSGNRSEEPVCFENSEALSRLHGIADLFLMHDRPIQRFVDDSVVRIAAGRPLLIRRSRGYVPTPITIPLRIPKSLALGGEQKHTIAIGSDHTVFLSRHIGDLDSPRSLSAAAATIDDLSHQLRITPDCIARDPHPDHRSVRIARSFDKPVQLVQHHYAHILSVMADNGIDKDVLGIAWDGTGIGDDGTIWGGEFLKANGLGFRRFASLSDFPLLGGEKAIREPRRIAIALLYECYGRKLWEKRSLAPLSATPESERRIFEQMMNSGIHSPKTSSMGRIFDGVASLLGIRQSSQFEGQAAMELEYSVDDGDDCEPYPFEIERSECLRVDWRPMVRAIVDNLEESTAIGQLASRFHSTLAEVALQIAYAAREHDVVLGGGCFQNRILLERTISRLRDGGFEVWWPKQAPPNDGGLALGQIVALNQFREAGN